MRIRLFGAFLIDLVLVALAWLVAFQLRFNFVIPSTFVHHFWSSLPVVLFAEASFLYFLGVYSSLWRYASLPDLRRLVIASLGAIALASFGVVLALPSVVVPRSVWVIHLLLVWVLLGGVRVLVRTIFEGRLRDRKARASAKPMLVLGAGAAGLALARDLMRSREWNVVGFLDDDSVKAGRKLYGVKILGRIEKLAEVCAEKKVDHVILAIPSASYAQRSRILKLCRSIEGLQILTIPSLEDIMSGSIPLSQIKKLDIEDLLGRNPVELDLGALESFLAGKTVMITGAGGSIGSELCRQLRRFGPAKLVFVEKSEPALYHLEQEFSEATDHKVPFEALLGDVKDSSRIQWILEKYRPHAVFHAAAYKHVPLVEEGNAWEAIRNNAWGSYNVARLCAESGVEKFVLISTDKAVRPCNVMGASKRLAEVLVQGLAGEPGIKTKFITVRFGNVLGSQGSVIPKFRRQLLEGGPLTVTHPDMERFFMSIPEATQLVLQAATMGKGGEIFVLEMGTPVKLVELAKDMIRLSGLTEDSVEIQFSGLRPGEKLYEELFNEGEEQIQTEHTKIRIAKARSVTRVASESILDFVSGSIYQEDVAVRQTLSSFLSDYTHKG